MTVEISTDGKFVRVLDEKGNVVVDELTDSFLEGRVSLFPGIFRYKDELYLIFGSRTDCDDWRIYKIIEYHLV
jgi:hypothetical protein